ncbi:transporter [Mesorhizobium amorphae]|uniref:transporter n=1 Tax=Mesorhizobium amorphae TaxID=71433 RepID=UPI001184F794|nr:transporter [Mesorhizobium amorphae]
MSTELIILFVLSIVCDVFGQIAFKFGADALPEFSTQRWQPFARALFADRWVGIGLVIYVAEFIIWVRILTLAPLGIAFPLASLNILAITLAGRLWLGEKTGPSQWLGALLITAGVILVAGTI